MAECIVLKGGGGADLDVVTAGASDMLAGKVIVDKDGNPLTGTMPNRGAVSQALNAGGSYTVPPGYHNGSGMVTANNLASQTSATATAGNILNGQTAWVNGNKLSGAMPDYGKTPTQINNIRINNNRFEVAVAAGYHGEYWAVGGYEYMSYDQVANAIGLTAAKLKKGEVVCGRTGTFEGYVPTATDLYLRGNNIAGFTFTNSASAVSFESGGIKIYRAGPELKSANQVNFTPYNYLNIEVYYESYVNTIGNSKTNFKMRSTLWDGTTTISTGISSNITEGKSVTFSIPVSTLSLTRIAHIRIYVQYDALEDNSQWVTYTTVSWNGYVYRIWLS